MQTETTTTKNTRQIGELLVQEQLITQQKLNRALELQQQDYAPIGKILMELEYITEADLHSVLAKQFGFIYLNPRGFKPPNKDLIQLIPESIAREFSCFPIEKTETSLTLAMADPWDTKIIFTLSKETNLTIQPRFSRKEWILDIIDEQYRRNG
jgi:type IV pilus assembly protein PilB